MVDPAYKDWLVKIEDDETSFGCSACGYDGSTEERRLSCASGKSALDRHRNSTKHVGYCIQKRINIVSDQTANQMRLSEGSFEMQKMQIEVDFAKLVASCNISFRAAPKLFHFCQDVAAKYPLQFQKIKCKATKLSGITRNVVAPAETERLCRIVRDTNFTVFVDETTGKVQGNKMMAIVCRYVDPDTWAVQTELIRMLELDPEKESDSEGMFKSFMKVLNELNIPIQNCLCYSCDNASVMIGKNKSFKVNFEKKVDKLFTLGCPCHRVAIVAKTAFSAHFAEDIDPFMTGVIAYVRKVPSRRQILRDISMTDKNMPLILTPYCATRWLSRGETVKKFISFWSSLETFFENQHAQNPKKENAKKFLDLFKDPGMKAKFHFVDSVIVHFDNYNKFFQSDKTRIHLLQEKSLSLLLQIATKFATPCVVKFIRENPLRANTIDWTREGNVKDLSLIDVGVQCESILESMDHRAALEIRGMCFAFYVASAQEIQRLLFQADEFLIKLNVFSPDFAMYGSKSHEEAFENVEQVASRLCRGNECNMKALKEEWSDLRDAINDMDDIDDFEFEVGNDFDKFWLHMFDMETARGLERFPNLAVVVNKIRTLPNSNAPAERMFSHLTNTVTPNRSLLSPKTTNALCTVKSATLARPKNCRITGDHINRMTSKTVYEKANMINRSSESNIDM